MQSISAEFEKQYSALSHGVGCINFSNRTQLEFTGADRSKFLHNLCTNAVRDLPVGNGCEAFVLNVKGHIVGHVFLFVGPNSIVLETVPDQAEKLLAHFNRYLIREDVQIANRSQTWAEFFVAGPQTDPLLCKLGVSLLAGRLSHTATTLTDCAVWLRKIDLAGPYGYLLACPREVADQVQTSLITGGVVICGDQVFQTARIEYGTPLFGQDVSEANLPQEIDRDRLAINFSKGCYLGQETVARIDALGHVNLLLRGVKFSGTTTPLPETSLQVNSPASTQPKSIGRVTSTCWSPRLDAPLGLALIHRDYAPIGSQLQSQYGLAEVVTLPLQDS